MNTPTDHTDPSPGADGAALLDRVRAALGRYVILPSEAAATGVTLWIAATHAQPAWAHAPRLVIRGPEKRCGKSRLLDVVEALAWAPLITVNSSPAAVYRSITADPPTLLVDEADTIFGPKADGNEDLRGLLNAGHQRNRPAIRYDAAANRVEKIPTFAMAALAGIGAMPDTIEDRAVIVRMRRRADGETVSPYRHRRDRPALRRLAEELHIWLRGDLAELEQAEPAMPVEDRAADTWEPLIAVADHAGGHWPDHARAAVLALQTETADNGETSDRTRLLADCHAAFADLDAIPSTLLLQRLRSDPEAPWIDYGHNGLTPRKLGILLHEYGIRSANIRFTEGQAKGFQRADFDDAWRRYTPELLSTEGVTRPTRPNLITAGQRGTEESPGTGQPVPRPDAGTERPVPPGQPVPGLTCDGTLGTGGTGHPPLRLVEG
ncbi:DUF3631 domain-containing protein [Pseudonocardia sp. N23]|uniref:DUF3631 domain-containing protein n=1 Tax=Pseudonocardia sp. N23 TaxID=1987376 RepID=UPI000C024245|nr:DUF3631 domain-containing protein [Pseudonocardia sp. N23]GAY11797.1 DNA primase [Pseudonocardia sp. N23]